MLKIEQGVPIPDKHIRRKTNVGYSMEVGDSVLFDTQGKAVTTYDVLRRTYGAKAGVVRKVEGGFRVWRVK